MIFFLQPILAMGAVPLNYVKVTVQKQNDFILHFFFIQRNRGRFDIFQSILQQSWLNHRNTVLNRLSVKNVPNVITLIKGNTESVYKMRAPQMENQLWQTFHVLRQSKWGFVIFHKVGVILRPFAQTLIQPLPYIFLFFIQRFVDAHSCQINSCCFFVKSFCNGLNSVTPFPLNCCNSRDILPRPVTIMRFQLNKVKLNL